MNQKEQKELYKIIISSFLLIISFLSPTFLKFPLYLISYLIVAINILLKALKNIFKGDFLDENFLMSIATIGAFFINQYFEAILVMLLYQIGELFQSYAVNKSRKSITELMDIRPDYANIEVENKIKKVDPEIINIGDLIIVKPGEKVPLDGVVVKGESYVDTSHLTGESTPKKIKVHDEILSGFINKNGVLTIKVTKKYSDSTVSKILELVENASSKKAKSEKFITKFARYYTPIVVCLALILVFIPPLIIESLTFKECLTRALTFLVISCPCALVISVPLSFFGGIGGAAKQGILIKGSNYLELMAQANILVFDKTGTLTEGEFKVNKINPVNITSEKLLEIAALGEYYSNHPIAESIKKAYSKKIDKKRLSNYEELNGLGISITIDKKDVLIGNEKLMQKNKIKISSDNLIGTIIHIAINKNYAGYILISDNIKDEVKETLNELKKYYNIEKTILLTGDNHEIASKVSREVNIDEFYSNLLPTDKVKKLEEILDNKQKNDIIAFVGDGINDAPVLTRADIGIAMGALGSDAAIEAADIVLMDDDIAKIKNAIKISKKTLKIVKQNIIFAISIKIFFLTLGALGLSNMLFAVFADVGVSIIAILNAMRTLKS